MGKEENQTSVLLGDNKTKLDGSWTFQAQFNALKSSQTQDDLTFKENSVKDVTDRGRQEGADRMQKALEIAWTATPPPKPPGQKALQMTPGPGEAEEAEVRREVKVHLKTLQRLREEGPTSKRDASVMNVLRQLRDLNVSVACLKATKIAAELNQPCWRGNEVSAELRRYSSSLVKEWRTMYRAETGTPEPAMSAAVRSRKSRRISMDLEESAYGRHQKVAHYMEVVDWTCKIIISDNEVSNGLLAGTLASKELLARSAEELRWVEESVGHCTHGETRRLLVDTLSRTLGCVGDELCHRPKTAVLGCLWSLVAASPDCRNHFLLGGGAGLAAGALRAQARLPPPPVEATLITACGFLAALVKGPRANARRLAELRPEADALELLRRCRLHRPVVAAAFFLLGSLACDEAVATRISALPEAMDIIAAARTRWPKDAEEALQTALRKAPQPAHDSALALLSGAPDAVERSKAAKLRGLNKLPPV